MPGLEDEYEQAAREAMRVSLGVRGFVGGETLVELGHTDRRLMITKWRDLRAWKEWHASEERAMQCSVFYRYLPKTKPSAFMSQATSPAADTCQVSEPA